MISYLSLGANIGRRRATLRQAVALIGEIATVLRQSDIIETDPVGFTSPHKFLNMCLAIDTPLTPHALLRATQAIERQLGRTEKSTHGYHDRTIDIDILLYEDRVIADATLQIPHPRMHERDFVMIPLQQVLIG